MEDQACRFCGKEMEEAARFCSACGSELQDTGRVCAKCHQANPDEAHFCMTCGDDLTAQEMAAAVEGGNIHHLANTTVVSLNPIAEAFSSTAAPSKRHAAVSVSKSALVAGIIILLLAASAWAYSYYTRQVTQKFLTASSQVAVQIFESNQMLADLFNQPINAQTSPILAQMLPAYIQNLQVSADNWSATKCPDKYLAQKESLTSLVQVQLEIMEQIPAILAHPLVAETDAITKSLRENMAQATQISAQLQLPGVAIQNDAQLPVIADKLAAYTAQQREIYKAKLARLESMNSYFKQIDSILQKNNEAKSGLGTMLEKIRSGEYDWADYFTMIDGARTARANLLTQVNRVKTPSGAEEYSAELSRLLSQSINYCDIMKAGATAESKGDYATANKKYIEAQTLNDQIQSQYAAFNSKYQNGKAQLTNINNL